MQRRLRPTRRALRRVPESIAVTVVGGRERQQHDRPGTLLGRAPISAFEFARRHAAAFTQPPGGSASVRCCHASRAMMVPSGCSSQLAPAQVIAIVEVFRPRARTIHRRRCRSGIRRIVLAWSRRETTSTTKLKATSSTPRATRPCWGIRTTIESVSSAVSAMSASRARAMRAGLPTTARTFIDRGDGQQAGQRRRGDGHHIEEVPPDLWRVRERHTGSRQVGHQPVALSNPTALDDGLERFADGRLSKGVANGLRGAPFPPA